MAAPIDIAVARRMDAAGIFLLVELFALADLGHPSNTPPLRQFKGFRKFLSAFTADLVMP